MAINSLSVFSIDGLGISQYITPMVLIKISVSYTININKTIRT